MVCWGLHYFFAGLKATYKYCDKYDIPYKQCGKVVVATSKIEIERLEQLFGRAQENQVPGIRYLDNEAAIRDVEPYCRGLKALHSPMTGNQFTSCLIIWQTAVLLHRYF